MTILECLLQIRQVDNVANFFIEHIDELEEERLKNNVIMLSFSETVKIQYKSYNPLIFRIYDPLNEIVNRNAPYDGWTNWSM